MRNFIRFAVIPVLLFSKPACAAEAVMSYIYNAPESANDNRYVFQWEILRTALEKTNGTYGPYKMEPSVRMTEQRQALELESDSGKLSVMYLSTIPDFEHNLTPVRIPVVKNLEGYMVFLIRNEDQARFASVNSLDDLRKFSYGLGLGWIDVDILKTNGFHVVTGSDYEGLFEMLTQKRFDIFLRSTVEILDEYEQRKTLLPAIHIEDGIVLYYPLPMYFWFSKSENGKKLAARVEAGMWIMINDGTYDRMFDDYQRYKIERLDLKHRKTFNINNPFLGPETPFDNRKLWFDPQTYK